MSMTVILLIIVGAALIIPTLAGFIRGFLHTVLSIVSLVLAIVLVPLVQPVVRDVLANKTPVGSAIESTIETTLSGVAEKAIKEANHAASIPSLSTIPMTEDIQKVLAEALPLPKELQKYLNKNVSGSVELFVKNVGETAASIALDGASYLVTFIVIFIILKVLSLVLGIASHLPGLSGINRLFGAAIGLAEGLLILWVLCRVAPAFMPSDLGQQVMEAIADNSFLSFIYNGLYSIGGHSV